MNDLCILGDRCEIEIDECVRDTPCVHGTCNNTDGDYICSCDLGYEDKNCDKANCSHNQCFNGGTCSINTYEEWKCECPEFYEGWLKHDFIFFKAFEFLNIHGWREVYIICIPFLETSTLI